MSSQISLGIVAHGLFVSTFYLGVNAGRLLVRVLWRRQNVECAGCAHSMVSDFCAFRWCFAYMIKRMYAVLFVCRSSYISRKGRCIDLVLVLISRAQRCGYDGMHCDDY